MTDSAFKSAGIPGKLAYLQMTVGGETVFAPYVALGAGITVTADTEFPTAAALNGTWAKTTVSTISGGAVMGNDGTNLILISSGTGTAATALRTVSASDDPAVVALQIMDDWDNAASTGVKASGDVAHDAADAGEPVKIGGQARTTNPTAVADADRANFITDKLGKQVVVNSIRDLKGVQKTTITSSTSETTIVTAVASTFLDLYGLIISNSSATACSVTIKDSTSGTTRAIITVPATDVRGFILTESAAIPQATVNNNWTATCSASVASIEITALYVKNI